MHGGMLGWSTSSRYSLRFVGIRARFGRYLQSFAQVRAVWATSTRFALILTKFVVRQDQFGTDQLGALTPWHGSCVVVAPLSMLRQDFVDRLIQHDPAERATVDQMLAHPWLKSKDRWRGIGRTGGDPYWAGCGETRQSTKGGVSRTTYGTTKHGSCIHKAVAIRSA